MSFPQCNIYNVLGFVPICVIIARKQRTGQRRSQMRQLFEDVGKEEGKGNVSKQSSQETKTLIKKISALIFMQLGQKRKEKPMSEIEI